MSPALLAVLVPLALAALYVGVELGDRIEALLLDILEDDR